MITSINLKALSGAILAAMSAYMPTSVLCVVDRMCTGYSTAAETRKAIIANVECLWTYYKETYQEDEGDD